MEELNVLGPTAKRGKSGRLLKNIDLDIDD